MFLATVVADAISSIEPGTSAHSTPAEPISPTNHCGNASLATDSSARSVSVLAEVRHPQHGREADEEHERDQQLVERHERRVAA